MHSSLESASSATATSSPAEHNAFSSFGPGETKITTFPPGKCGLILDRHKVVKIDPKGQTQKDGLIKLGHFVVKVEVEGETVGTKYEDILDLLKLSDRTRIVTIFLPGDNDGDDDDDAPPEELNPSSISPATTFATPVNAVVTATPTVSTQETLMTTQKDKGFPFLCSTTGSIGHRQRYLQQKDDADHDVGRGRFINKALEKRSDEDYKTNVGAKDAMEQAIVTRSEDNDRALTDGTVATRSSKRKRKTMPAVTATTVTATATTTTTEKCCKIGGSKRAARFLESDTALEQTQLFALNPAAAAAATTSRRSSLRIGTSSTTTVQQSASASSTAAATTTTLAEHNAADDDINSRKQDDPVNTESDGSCKRCARIAKGIMYKKAHASWCTKSTAYKKRQLDDGDAGVRIVPNANDDVAAPVETSGGGDDGNDDEVLVEAAATTATRRSDNDDVDEHRSRRTTVDGYLLVDGDTLVNDYEILSSEPVRPILVWQDKWITELSDVYEKLTNNVALIKLSDGRGLNAMIKLELLEDYNTGLSNRYYMRNVNCASSVSGKVTILIGKKKAKNSSWTKSQMLNGVARSEAGYYKPTITLKRIIKLSETKQVIVNFHCCVEFHVLRPFNRVHKKEDHKRTYWETIWYNAIIKDGDVKSTGLTSSHMNSIRDDISLINNQIEPANINSSRSQEHCCGTCQCIGIGCEMMGTNPRCHHNPPCRRVYLFVCVKCVEENNWNRDMDGIGGGKGGDAAAADDNASEQGTAIVTTTNNTSFSEASQARRRKRKSEPLLYDNSWAEKKKKKKKKKKKDPNAPKGIKSAYIFFNMHIHPSVKHDNPEASFGDIARIIGEKFMALNPNERNEFDDMAKEDKSRYKQEKEIYDRNNTFAADDDGDDGDDDDEDAY